MLDGGQFLWNNIQGCPLAFTCMNTCVHVYSHGPMKSCPSFKNVTCFMHLPFCNFLSGRTVDLHIHITVNRSKNDLTMWQSPDVKYFL